MLMRPFLSRMIGIIGLSLLLIVIGPISAVYADDGSISGTIYESDGVTAITSGTVTAVPVGGGDSVSTAINSDGTYSLGVPPNDYLVWAESGSYARQYYDDAILENATPVIVTSGTESSGIDISLTTFDSTILEQLTFNLTVAGLDDLAVRQAIAYGTDRARLSSDVFGNPTLNTYYGDGHWAQADDSELTLYPYNLTTAQNTLTTAGWVDTDADNIRDKDGVSLSFDLYTVNSAYRAASVTIFQENMADIGIDIIIHLMSANDFFNETTGPLVTGNYDMAEFAWNFDDNEDNDIPPALWMTASAQNYGSYSSASADTAVTNGQAATTRATKLPYAIEHQQILADDLPILPLVNRADGTTLGTGSISGHVYHPNGSTPMEGVTVTATLGSSGFTGTAVSGIDGSYSITGLGAGDYTVSAEGAGFVLEYYNNEIEENATPVTVAMEADTSDIDFANGLVGYGEISGTVYDETGTTPLENILVSLKGDGLNLSVCTDVNGYYTFSNVPLNELVQVVASPLGDSWCGGPENYVQEYWQEVLGENQATSISLNSGTPDHPNTDFTLELGGTISGTVYDETGTTPLENIIVSLNGDYFSGGTCTDVNGEYSIEGVPFDQEVRLVASPLGGDWCGGPENYVQEYWQETLRQNEATLVSVSAGSPTLSNIDFTLELGGTISGTVYDETGTTPLQNIVVSLNGNNLSGGVCTDADGEYTIDGVPFDMQVQIVASPLGDNWCSGPENYVQEYWQEVLGENQATSISLSVGSPNLPNVNFTLAVGGTISGTVYDETGTTPLENIVVALNSDHLSSGICTDANGNYAFDGVPFDEPVRVQAATQGGNWCGGSYAYLVEFWEETSNLDEATLISVSSGTPEQIGIDFTLEVGGSVSGTVFNETGTTPLANIPVYLWGGGGYYTTCSEVDGSYTFPGLPKEVELMVSAGNHPGNECGGPDEYVPEFWEEARLMPNHTPLVLTDGMPDLLNIDFTLELGGTISGTVTDQNGGAPLANMVVSPDGPDIGGVCSDINGDYIIHGVPLDEPVTVRASSGGGPNNWCGGPENYVLEFWQDKPDGNEADWVIVPSGSPNTTGIDFTLELGGTITGTVYDETGTTELENMPVHWSVGSYGEDSCTDANGNYEFQAVPFDIDLRVWAGDHRGNSCGGPDDYVEEYWEQKTGWSSADVITLSEGTPDHPDTDFTLELGGVISGTITDVDGGAPISNMVVSLDGDPDGYGVCTDANGEYTFHGVPFDTEFRLRMGQPWGNWCGGENNYVREYWQEVGPGALRWDQADIVVVTSGTTPLIGMDGALELGGSISGTIYDDALVPNEIPNMELVVEGGDYQSYSCSGSATGDYTFYGVPFDTPVFVLAGGSNWCAGGPTGLAQEFWQGKARLTEATLLTLTDPGTTAYSNIDFTLSPRATQAGWEQANESGFGDGDNYGIQAQEVFNNELYAAASNSVDGVGLWRTSNGHDWTQVGTSGLGDGANNPVIRDMIAFGGQFYASGGDWQAQPGQLWRSPNGTTWAQIAGLESSTAPFGPFTVYNGNLYTATCPQGIDPAPGVEIWRSATGNDSSWATVVAGGLGNTNNTCVTGLIAYNGALYAAVENEIDGAQIWRSTSGDTGTWSQVNTSGFGSIDTIQTGGFAIFDGQLYVGTRNYITGAHLYRTSNGTTWNPVMTNGFGLVYNNKIESLVSFGGALYAVTDNPNSGSQVWRSPDGTSWSQINNDGYGDYANTGTLWSSASAIFHNHLFIGSYGADGAEVWRMKAYARNSRNDFDGEGTRDLAVFRPYPGMGVWFVLTQSNVFSATQWGQPGDIPVAGDYNGDGLADIAVFKPTNAVWDIKDQISVAWGQTGDIPVPGDYNNDGTVDIAVYRPSTGVWYVRNGVTVTWGGPGDVPVPGDYDGDGDTDIAVYRSSTGGWYVKDQFQDGWGDVGDTPVPGDYNGDGKTDLAVYRRSNGVWYVKNQFQMGWGDPTDIPMPGDYNGDEKTDIAVYRPLTGVWYVKDILNIGFGMVGDQPITRPLPYRRTLGDFNADDKTDVAVYRPSNGTWYVQNQFQTAFGISGDIPVYGDYNGDGRSDLAIYRPSNGLWFVKDQFQVGWGSPGDIPVRGDYNGDGKTDVAVYRPSNGLWFVKDQFQVGWGIPGDIPVPDDYNGDGKTDIAIYRPSTGVWYIKDQFAFGWGSPGDTPVPSDYNGDGKTDLAVYRPSNGLWFVKDYTTFGWGISGDTPVPGDYNGDGKADLAVYRPSNGVWYVKDYITVGWGSSGDIPLPSK